MNCPACGAWSRVLRTVDGARRRRECANNHRFTTQEMVVPMGKPGRRPKNQGKT